MFQPFSFNDLALKSGTPFLKRQLLVEFADMKPEFWASLLQLIGFIVVVLLYGTLKAKVVEAFIVRTESSFIRRLEIISKKLDSPADSRSELSEKMKETLKSAFMVLLRASWTMLSLLLVFDMRSGEIEAESGYRIRVKISWRTIVISIRRKKKLTLFAVRFFNAEIREPVTLLAKGLIRLFWLALKIILRFSFINVLLLVGNISRYVAAKTEGKEIIIKLVIIIGIAITLSGLIWEIYNNR